MHLLEVELEKCISLYKRYTLFVVGFGLVLPNLGADAVVLLKPFEKFGKENNLR